MLIWLNKDMATLRKILGKNFLPSNKTLKINRHKILEIEKMMTSTLSPQDNNLLLPQVKQLRHIPTF